MPHDRYKFLELLAKHEGKLTTNQIKKELGHTVRELEEKKTELKEAQAVNARLLVDRANLTNKVRELERGNKKRDEKIKELESEMEDFKSRELLDL